MGLSTENRFLLFWSILGAVAFLAIWHLPWRFQLNDDMIMLWLVRGDYTGQPESYAVFIHPVLSWSFSKLYTIFPQINWYPITWFLIMYFSFLVFLISIWKKYSELYLKTFLSVFLLAFVIHFLFFLQFSIVAAFAIASGLTARGLRFFQEKSSNDKKNIPVFSFQASDLLILLGALIRIEVLFLFLAGFAVLELMVYRKLNIIRALILPTTLFGALFFINQIVVQSEGLVEFNRVNKLRSSVFDDPVLQLNKESYRESNPELYFFANGLMDFSRVNDLSSKMETWEKGIGDNRMSALSPKFIFNAFSYWIWHERYFCLLLFMIFGISLILQFRNSLISIFVLLGIMVCLSPFFLLKIQIYVIILLVYFASFLIFGSDLRLGSRISIPSTGMLFFLIIFHFSSFFSSEKNLFPKEEFDSFQRFDSFILNDTNLYLVGMDHVNYYYIDKKPFGIYYLGWPSLLLKDNENPSVYRVSRKVYKENLGYFSSSKILYEYPEYLDLIFLK